MKTVVRLYRFRILTVLLGSVLLVSCLAGAGILGIRKLDDHLNVILLGNALPIKQLDELRSAELDARREIFRTVVSRDPGRLSRSLEAIRRDIRLIDKSWAEYYPAGVSGPHEEVISGELNRELPRLKAGLEYGAVQLQAGDFANATVWLEKNLDFLNHFDSLVAEDIETNVDQATQLSSESQGVLRTMLLTMLILVSLSILAMIIGSFYVLRQRDVAVAESKYHSWLTNRLFELTQDGVMVTDANGKIQRVNPAFTRLTGYTPSDVLGRNPRILSSGRQPPGFYGEFWKELKDKGYWNGELWNRRKSGDLYLESLTIAGVRDGVGNCSHYVAMMTDITQRVQKEERLNHFATHDALTGLPNRMLLNERLQQAVLRARRKGNRVAVMFIDLDGFKQINDTWGHGAGDDVLRTVAERLRHALRETDTVARLGGDEFVAVLEGMHERDEMIGIAQKLIHAVGRAIDVGDSDACVTPSIGISIFPEDGTSAEQLSARADEAMYIAKGAGKNQFCFYADVASNAVVR